MSTLAIGGSRLRPLPLLKVGQPPSLSVQNIRLPFSVYSTILNHGPITNPFGELGTQFDLQQIVTSSSGGVGLVVASTPTSVQLNPIAGTLIFNPGDTLTQQTGTNAGAVATQVGASAVGGPFAVGETLQSSDPVTGEAKGTGEILEVNAGDVLITGPGGSPINQALFQSGDVLTQLTGAAAGDTTVQSGAAAIEGLLAAQTVDYVFDLSNYINGRVRGNFRSDVEGELHVFYGNDPVNMDLDFTVPQDTEQPDFQYAFDIIVIQPFCRLQFINGVAPSTLFHAFVSALPV